MRATPRADNRGLKWKRMAVAGAVVLTVAGGAVGVSKIRDERAKQDRLEEIERIAQSAPEHEFELPRAEDFDFTLKAAAYEGTPERLVIDFFGGCDDWLNSVGNNSGDWLDDAQTFLDDEKRGVRTSEMAATLGKPSDEAFFRHAVRPDWRSDSSLSSAMDFWSQQKSIVAHYALLTTGRFHEEDREPFRRHLMVDADSVEILSATPDRVVGRVYLYTVDNSDKNRAKELIPNYRPPEEILDQYVTVSFARYGDDMRLYDLDAGEASGQ